MGKKAWLKADLHLHSNDDLNDYHLKYNSKELIDFMANKGYKVLSLTLHDHLYYPKDLVLYAKKKNIILILGIEKKIKGKEVLIYNVKKEEIDSIKDFKDLEKIRREDTLIVAPHPYYLADQCLMKELDKNIKYFDAIEFCFFYTKIINPNKKAIEIAKRNSMPMLASSDAHWLHLIGTNYTEIESRQDIISIIKAIKKKKVRIKTRALRLFEFLFIIKSFILDHIYLKLGIFDLVYKKRKRR